MNNTMPAVQLGNSNDLRGKILRIKINADGSYNIPEETFFRKTNRKTRPEIYVMGDRNPYRISFDKKSGFLYWGEVGPDAPTIVWIPGAPWLRRN